MSRSALAILSLLVAGSLFTASARGEGTVPETSEATFQKDVLKAKGPVLVDFYATWCPPCKALAPVVDGLSEKYAGKVAFYRIDVDKNRALAGKYHIEAIPNCKIFKHGKLVDETVGLVTADELSGKLDKAL
jgi:thioredoxin 1